MKATSEASFFPADEWIRRLGNENAAFDVANVVTKGRRGQRRLGWDWVVTLAVKPDNRRVDLFVQAKSQVTPKAALAAFEQLKWVPPDGLFMLCAPVISPRVAEICQGQNVSYLDGVGNCRISAPGLFIHISGRPNRPSPIQANIHLFSRKSSRITRTILTHPDQPWQVQQLAKQAEVSLGLASKIKRALVDEAYLEERGRLLHLRDPARLLKDWAAQYRPYVKRLQLFTISKPFETELRIADWCRKAGMPYALTQLSAAWRYSPLVRYDKSVLYIDKTIQSAGNLAALLRHLDAREVDTGVNCTLWLTDDAAVFSDAREIQGVNIVSPLQAYLDLKALAGRGEEAAQEILDKELGRLRSESGHESERPSEGMEWTR